jgi:hypothetical protein
MYSGSRAARCAPALALDLMAQGGHSRHEFGALHCRRLFAQVRAVSVALVVIGAVSHYRLHEPAVARRSSLGKPHQRLAVSLNGIKKCLIL